MSNVLGILGVLGGLFGALAAAFVAVRRAPSEIHLTEAQERKLAIETEMLVTQTLRDLRLEIEEMRRKLAEAEAAAANSKLSESRALRETEKVRARLAELEKEVQKLTYQLKAIKRLQDKDRSRVDDLEHPPERET